MIPEKVQRILTQHGLEVHEFEEGSTPTVATAARKLNVTEGQIAKSLLFRGKSGAFYMVVCAGDRKVSAGKLKRLVGEKTTMANARELLEITGFPPGGACPFGVTEIPIYLDVSMNEYDVVYPAAGTDSSGVAASYEQLKEITGGKSCDVVGTPD